jgi:hypothetical protein
MRTVTRLVITTAAVLGSTTPALAQQSGSDTTVRPVITAVAMTVTTDSSAKPASDSGRAKADPAPAPAAQNMNPAAATRAATQPQITIQHIRALDQRGINVFESPKYDNVDYNGFVLSWGAAFASQFQGLDHKNTAQPKVVAGVDQNQLVRMGHGFNNETANLYLNAQMARGIRVALTSYLSARHHNETWVKDGYLLIDDSPIRWQPLVDLMQIVTVKAGHFEINYGDQHFRRTDNGNAMYNPFVGNLIMDAFTTEVGGEVYARLGSVMAMGGVTNGEVRGQITAPQKRAPSILGKVGFDRQFSPDLRIRLTGSLYTTKHSANNTLYSGDRGGSRYYDVLENTASSEAAQAWSGNIQPGLSDKVTATVINPFIKFRGLELFGNIETAKGRKSTEASDRTWNQQAAEAVYRFGPAEQLYVGGRYNTVNGKLTLTDPKETVDRTQASAGWFITPGVLLKAEYVNQKYDGFLPTDIRNGGKFSGYVFEGVVAF